MGLEWLRGNEEYGALMRALRRKTGFGLFFVQASPAKGADILAALREELSSKKITIVTLKKENQDLFEPMAAAELEQPDIFWVEGLEQSLLGYEDIRRMARDQRDLSHYTTKDVPPILGRLNLSRERFATRFPHVVVIVVPLFVIRYLLRRAGDFFDWKSGFFEFLDENPHEEIRSFVESTELEVYAALEPTVLTQKIVELQSCIDHEILDDNEKASLYQQLARLFQAVKDYDAALLNHEKALVLKPEYYEAWNGRGIRLNSLGRYEEAVSSFDQAIEIKSDFYQAYFHQGIALTNLGRYEMAISSLDKVIKFKSDDHNSWFLRGINFFNLRRHEEAIESYKKAINIRPSHHSASYFQGLSLANLGRNKEAVLSYDQAIKFNPTHPEAWFNRGNSLGTLEKYEESIDSFDKAIELRPNYSEAWFNRGNSLGILGKYEESVKSFNKAIEFDPENSVSYQKRGTALYQLGQFQQAYQDFEYLTNTEPEEADNWNNAGYLLLTKESYGMIPVFEKSLAIRPVKTQYNEIITQRLFSYRKSLVFFDHSILLNSNTALYWGNRSLPLYRLGDFSTALTSCKRSIQLGLNDEVNHSNLGIILLRLQRPAEAQTSFETALTIYPNYPDAHYGLACAYALQNQLAPTLEHLKQAIELNPNHYRTLAQTDSDFDSIRDNEQFQALLSDP
jgi:tetratricopeptide (TPR) repeat protein